MIEGDGEEFFDEFFGLRRLYVIDRNWLGDLGEEGVVWEEEVLCWGWHMEILYRG